jgi:hypothetical protein
MSTNTVMADVCLDKSQACSILSPDLLSTTSFCKSPREDVKLKLVLQTWKTVDEEERFFEKGASKHFRSSCRVS